MPRIVHLDYETRSHADITETGAFRYAEDDTTDIMCAAMALDDEEPVIWVNPEFENSGVKSDPKADRLRQMLGNEDILVYAHNAQFEYAISHGISGWENDFNLIIPQRLRCTAALARRAAIPASLEKAAQTLGLMQQKDTRGSKLIKKFSIPDKKTGRFTEPHEDPAAFKEFIEYCLQDVRVEREIHKKLKSFDLAGPLLDAFIMDMVMNSRGMPLNVAALKHAQKVVNEAEAQLIEKFHAFTGLMPTQNVKLLAWMKDHGYTGDNLQATTMEAEVESGDFDPTTEWGQALLLKQQLSYASIKKIPTMLACACSDGRARGGLQFYGAGTGRWSGRLFQPQNFKRPTIKHTDEVYKAICNGESTGLMEIMYGNPLECVSSCIRNFIHDPEGPIFDVDYSAIEARIVAWLAGQEDAVQEYRDKIDSYRILASVIFNVPLAEVTDFQRLIGKYAKLGCGYGMGPRKFRITCAKYGRTLPYYVVHRKTGEMMLETEDESAARVELKKLGKQDYKLSGLEFVAVKAYRTRHPEIQKLWYACEKAIKQAVRSPGSKFTVRNLEFFCITTAGSNYLFIRLPSGRRLAYRDPQINMVPVFEEDEDGNLLRTYKRDAEGNVVMTERITYWGAVEGKAAWGRVDLYGAKGVENICQAIAADIMMHGAVTAEKAGFQLATLIHDQCLAYKRGNQKLEDLCACLTNLPPWAKGLPIDVEGKIVPYYKK